MSIWSRDMGAVYERMLHDELCRRISGLRVLARRGADNGGGALPSGYARYVVREIQARGRHE